MVGILRGKRVGRDEFAKSSGTASTSAAPRCSSTAKGQTFERIANGGRDGDPDAISTAVPGSLAPVPWAQVPTAQVLLAMADCDRRALFRRSAPGAAARRASRCGTGADCRRRNGARVLPGRSGRRASDAEGRTHARHAPRAGWPAVRQHGGRRECRRFPRRALRGLRGAEHSGRRDAQGVLARASSRSICTTSPTRSSPAIMPCC